MFLMLEYSIHYSSTWRELGEWVRLTAVTLAPWLVLTGRPSAYNSAIRCRRFFTGRMPRSGKLPVPVINLLTGQKSGFSARSGESLHRFTFNLAEPTGTWVRLPVQNFTSIATGGWECGPNNIKNFHFFVKCRPEGATPLTDFKTF